jgi:hypothetical protein
MVKIEYCKEGESISDFDYDKWIEIVKSAIIKNQDITFKVSTSIPIHAIRLEIIKGNIECNDVVFVYKEEEYHSNEFGEIQNHPNGFAGLHWILCGQIVMAQIYKRGN